MTCYRPSMVPVSRHSVVTGRKIRYTQEVGCGSCIGCRADQARDWSIRLNHESRCHRDSWFLTLTYNDEALPADGSLVPEHLSRFNKALRRRGFRFSFYGCGEYGSDTKRAHYHSVLFGPEFLDLRASPRDGGGSAWLSEAVASAWPHGFHELSRLTEASAAYVAGYVRKKLKARMDEAWRFDPRTGAERAPEFARMSLRPAIGYRFLRRWWRDIYPRDFVVVGGKELRPPRYYDLWMMEDHSKRPRPQDRCFPDGCAEHLEVIEAVKQRRFEEMEEISPGQLRVREATHEARDGFFARRDGL